MKLFKDFDERQFYLTIWSGVLTTIVVVSLIISYSTLEEDKTVAALVRDGYSPLELACVYRSTDATTAPCLLLANKELIKQKK